MFNNTFSYKTPPEAACKFYKAKISKIRNVFHVLKKLARTFSYRKSIKISLAGEMSGN